MIRNTILASIIAIVLAVVPTPAPKPVPVPPDAQALQRVVMSMRAGICPKCGVIDNLRVDRIGNDFPSFFGWRCTEPNCGFSATDEQVWAVMALQPGAADLAAWNKWAGVGQK